jgi:hypothetical protein
MRRVDLMAAKPAPIEFWPWHDFVRHIAWDPLIAKARGEPLVWTTHPERGVMFWPAAGAGIEVMEEPSRDGELREWLWYYG